MDPVDQASPGKAEGGADGWVSWWRVCIIIIIQYNIIYIYILLYDTYIHYIDGAYGVDLNCSCLFVLSFSRSLFLIYIYTLYAKSPLLSIKAILKCPSIGFRENMQGTPIFGFTQTNLWEYEDRPNIDQGDETIKTMSKWWSQQLSYLK